MLYEAELFDLFEEDFNKVDLKLQKSFQFPRSFSKICINSFLKIVKNEKFTLDFIDICLTLSDLL